MGLGRGPFLTNKGLQVAFDGASQRSAFTGGPFYWYDMVTGLRADANGSGQWTKEQATGWGSFYWNGTDTYFDTPAFTALNNAAPSTITLEVMIKPEGPLDSNDRKVMHYDKTGSTNAVFQLRKGNTNSTIMYQAHNGSQWYTMTDADALEADTYAHIVCTHNGTSAIMYKNGVQSATATMGNLSWTNANNILIGYRASSEYWKGWISILRIYDRILSASEVLNNFVALKNRFSL